MLSSHPTDQHASRLFLAVFEERIAKPRAYGENSPRRYILHKGNLAQSLHHGIVMHDHNGFVISQARNGGTQFVRQIEARAFPIAGQILASRFYRTVRLYLSGAANADEGRQL